MNFLSGYKTYIAGTILLVWSIYAGMFDIISKAEAVNMVLMALGILGLRSAISKLEE